jgi:hypothetical protein
MRLLPISRRRLIIIIVIGFLALSFPFLEAGLSYPEAEPILSRPMTEAEKQSVELLADVTKLLISWSFGLLAAVAWAAKRHIEGAARFSIFGRVACMICASGAIYSAFFGQVLLTSLASLLSRNVFALHHRSILVPGTLQTVSLLVSLVAAAAYIADGLFQPQDVQRHGT